jgi:hypothetical protein
MKATLLKFTEEKLRAKAQRAAEAAERRAEFLTNLTAHQPQNHS